MTNDIQIRGMTADEVGELVRFCERENTPDRNKLYAYAFSRVLEHINEILARTGEK